jgi:hypothetical protein
MDEKRPRRCPATAEQAATHGPQLAFGPKTDASLAQGLTDACAVAVDAMSTFWTHGEP